MKKRLTIYSVLFIVGYMFWLHADRLFLKLADPQKGSFPKADKVSWEPKDEADYMEFTWLLVD